MRAGFGITISSAVSGNFVPRFAICDAITSCKKSGKTMPMTIAIAQLIIGGEKIVFPFEFTLVIIFLLYYRWLIR